MGFETKVLAEVATVLKRERSACFYNGSLFVECTVAEAVKVETALLKNVVTCGIILSRAGDESVFDFV